MHIKQNRVERMLRVIRFFMVDGAFLSTFEEGSNAATNNMVTLKQTKDMRERIIIRFYSTDSKV
jgi:hypothetical protein